MTQRYKYTSQDFTVSASHWYAAYPRARFFKKEFSKEEWFTQIIAHLKNTRPNLKDSGHEIKAGTTWSKYTREGYIVEV